MRCSNSRPLLVLGWVALAALAVGAAPWHGVAAAGAGSELATPSQARWSAQLQPVAAASEAGSKSEAESESLPASAAAAGLVELESAAGLELELSAPDADALRELLSKGVAGVTAQVAAAFQAWRAKFAKQYAASELAKRLAIFAANVRRVLELNAKKDGVEYSTDGPFSDLTPEEFEARYTAPIDLTKSVPISFLEQEAEPFQPQPDDIMFEAQAQTGAGAEADAHAEARAEGAVDWRHICTPIKDQGKCGSCWAIAAAATFESAIRKSGKPLAPISTQQLLDCETTQNACNGGLTTAAFEYWKKHGSVPESWYKFTGVKGPKCKAANGQGPRVKSYGGVAPFCKDYFCAWQAPHEHAILTALKKYGPLVADISSYFAQFYKGGVVSEYSCKSSQKFINHSVVIVGYDPNRNAWIVRNSWGSYWGEKGYFRLQKGQNVCGIANRVVYVTA